MIDFEEMTALAAHLFREVRPDFFRVLAGSLAYLYVDALDALERERVLDIDILIMFHLASTGEFMRRTRCQFFRFLK
jgi:hypothetical protein